MKNTRKISIALVIAMVLLMALAVIPASAATISGGSKIYLNAGGSSLWDQGNAWFSVYFMDANKANCKFVTMTADQDSGYYVAEAPAGTWTYVIFVRNNPIDKNADWTNVWNQTADLALQDGKNLYTITGWGGTAGNWSNYTPTCTNHAYNEYGKCTNEGCIAGHTYTIAGTGAHLGTEWDVLNTANDMLYNPETKVYTKVYTNVTAGTYKFKCAQDHAWGTAYPSEDKEYTVETTGSTVTITIDENKVVDVTVVAPHVHSWSNATCTEPQKCECGETQGDALGHSYLYPCDAHCAICGELTNEDAAHTVVHVEAKAATNCQTYDGNIEYWYCSDCGTAWTNAELTMQTNLRSVKVAAAHQYMYPCDAHCAICGELTNEDAAHTVVHVEAKAATNCQTYDGNIEYWYCSDCGTAWTNAELTMQTNLRSVKVAAAHQYAYPCDAHCMVCYELTNEDATHNIVHFDAVPGTDCQTYDGKLEFWGCESCGSCWLDEALTQQTNRMSLATTGAHQYMYPCDAHCMVCYELTNEDATHNIVHVDALAPTCCSIGNIEYWYCSDCGSAWTDEALTRITNVKAVKLGTVDHSYNIDGQCKWCDSTTVFFEYLGVGVRYKDKDGKFESLEAVDVRVGYQLSEYVTAWGWNYQLGNRPVAHANGLYKTTDNGSNIVFADVVFANLDKTIKVQIWVTVTIDGESKTYVEEGWNEIVTLDKLVSLSSNADPAYTDMVAYVKAVLYNYDPAKYEEAYLPAQKEENI